MDLCFPLQVKYRIGSPGSKIFAKNFVVLNNPNVWYSDTGSIQLACGISCAGMSQIYNAMYLASTFVTVTSYYLAGATGSLKMLNYLSISLVP